MVKRTLPVSSTRRRSGQPGSVPSVSRSTRSEERPVAARPNGSEPTDEDTQAIGESGQADDRSLGLRDRVQKIRERPDRMGAINLAAIEEHQALDERHRFLTTQEEDLSNSVKALKEIISRINRTTEQLFMDTFNELQQKFGEVFARFFQGGRAELVLIEPEVGEDAVAGSSDEPGVDIVAQPPGKRLKNIAMLSA